MKKTIKNIVRSSGAALLILFSASGCGDFLDINTDPNNPLDSRLDQVLPTVQTVIFEALGNGPGGMSDLTSQYVHHTVQRGPTNFYFFAGNEFSISNAWPNLYSGALADLNVMIDKATKRSSWTYLGIAQTLKAYTYSMMIDMWGKAAYTEFGQGAKNPFAKFDNGDLVYSEALKLLAEAAVNLEKAAVEKPAADDLIYGGSSEKWLKLTNSLQLKLYNQVRLTSLYDATAVEALLTKPNLAAVADGFKLLYGTTNNPENRHPLFKQDYADNNANYIDPYFYLIMTGDGTYNDVLEDIEDPRIPYYFYNQLAGDAPQNPATTAKFGDFLSIWFASYNIDPNEGFDQAQSQTLVGLYPCGGAYDDGKGVTGGVAAKQNPGLSGAGYQRLYTYFSHLFTRAELALTKGASGDPRELFKQGMEAAFGEVNELAPNDIPDADRDAYINEVLAKYDDADNAGKLELIITEKWIASFGSTIDAYTDYRRTGYPIMFDPNTDNNPFTILNRNYPVSIPYYTPDLQINPNADAQRDPGVDKVFWDID
jgi:hypothetical protein